MERQGATARAPRVVMLSTDYLPNIGGIAAHVYHLARAIEALGHEVMVLQPVGDASRSEPRLEWEPSMSPPVVRLRYPSGGSRYHRLWQRARAVVRGLRRLHEAGRPLIVHQHDYRDSSMGAAWFSRVHGVPWVWTNHSSAFLVDARTRSGRMAARLLYSGVRAVIAVSREIEAQSRALWHFPPHLLRYIPNGVDPEVFSPSVRPLRPVDGDAVVLCPRRMVEKNGVLYFALAARLLVQQRPDVRWRFVFAGSASAFNTDPRYARQVMTVLQPLTEAGYVVDLGNVPHMEMPRVYAMAHVVVLPSLMEAVSLAALEAMAMRRAVVATDVGGLPEVVRDGQTGLLVPAGDPNALARAILELQEHPVRRQQLAEAAHALVTREYTWSHVARKTVTLYHEVMGIRHESAPGQYPLSSPHGGGC
ncbi:glycosyltransferase family 4 protein [Carboxydochorda subterranea]|uniref:Glycosyltransferase family 4 protein n=1 Tax=Carboxydichorda subterranea TaxID=3109565 RepID=A0ABZ1BTC0_9FIRM|nr:glycosyltransferase family 4 protein [Limnochorda sp. L945t]WRP16037.1 glycosyltransferase family 4 protein [Limnochorda sp. L945t]